MTTLIIVVALALIAVALAYALLEKRPGYGAYYGLAQFTGAPRDIGPVDWRALIRHATPNDVLVCPASHCPNAKPDLEPKGYVLTPRELLARLKKIALAEAGTRELPCAPNCERTARFVQRSRLMRFPDTIDIEVFSVGEKSTLAIYSRSLLGRRDFGVNRARIERWLAALDEVWHDLL
jgi:uncharacterized protein (DUF1499 family)